jgi:basic membrane lipoprotein Med (substrate-binding protein (PBP1-ABC) superfamily)
MTFQLLMLLKAVIGIIVILLFRTNDGLVSSFPLLLQTPSPTKHTTVYSQASRQTFTQTTKQSLSLSKMSSIPTKKWNKQQYQSLVLNMVTNNDSDTNENIIKIQSKETT